MHSPSPLPYRLGQRRADVARQRARIRREARERRRRLALPPLPVGPPNRIVRDRPLVSSRFWRGVANALLVQLAFIALGWLAYRAMWGA